ncbi:MAG: winged helix-turn-helix domain-containing protein [Candidatus Bathycorpusculaceae bacterium]
MICPNFLSASLLPSIRMFKYRDRTTIMGAILKTVKMRREAKKTQIMENVKLNYIQTKKYLSYLVSYGYLAITERQTYVITEKGKSFLQMVELQKIQFLR